MLASPIYLHRPRKTRGVRERDQSLDPVCSLVIKYCCSGWPSKSHINEPITPCWEARGDLTLQGDLLLHGTHIIVPASKQREILGKIYAGYQGIQRCRLNSEISVVVRSSRADRNDGENLPMHTARTPRKKPLMPSDLPYYPWQKIGLSSMGRHT